MRFGLSCVRPALLNSVSRSAVRLGVCLVLAAPFCVSLAPLAPPNRRAEDADVHKAGFSICAKASLQCLWLGTAVQRFRTRFPPAQGRPLHLQGQTHLALLRKRRVKLNGLCQKVAVERHRAKHLEGRVVATGPEEDAETRGNLSFAQPFQLFPGVSGVFLTLGQVREAD